MGDKDPVPSGTNGTQKEKNEEEGDTDQRLLENVMSSLNNMSEEQQIVALQDKYDDLYNKLVAMETQNTAAQQERDHIQTELAEITLTNAELERLCCELEERNKSAEETINSEKEEEERRREVARNSTEKLNSATTQTKVEDKSECEGQLANVNREIDYQMQIFKTQLQNMLVKIDSERNNLNKERQILTDNLKKSEQINGILSAYLQTKYIQIQKYKDQYSHYEATIANRTKELSTSRVQLANLQRTNFMLERERNEYHELWQSSKNSIMTMSDINENTICEMDVYERKLPLLEKMRRELHAERSSYRSQLLEHNIDPVIVLHRREGTTRPSTESVRSTSSTGSAGSTSSTGSARSTPRSSRSSSPPRSQTSTHAAQQKQKRSVTTQLKISKCKGMEESYFNQMVHICDWNDEIQLPPCQVPSCQPGPSYQQQGPSSQAGPSSRPDIPAEIPCQLVQKPKIAKEQTCASDKPEAVMNITELEESLVNGSGTDLVDPDGQGNQPNLINESEEEDHYADSIPSEEEDGETDLDKQL